MSVKIGTSTVAAIKVGTTDIEKAYQGTVLVWDTSTDDGETATGFTAPTLTLIDDDSYGSYIYKAIVEHATLTIPANVNHWRLHITGRMNESSPYIYFTDVYINLPIAASSNTVYRARLNGESGVNNIDMRAKYSQTTRRFEIFHGSQNQISFMTVKIDPRTTNGEIKDNESNTLTGIETAEDG